MMRGARGELQLHYEEKENMGGGEKQKLTRVIKNFKFFFSNLKEWSHETWSLII